MNSHQNIHFRLPNGAIFSIAAFYKEGKELPYSTEVAVMNGKGFVDTGIWAGREDYDDVMVINHTTTDLLVALSQAYVWATGEGKK